MITPDELGRRLRQAREREGQTQEDAAAVLGLDPTAIVKIEHGRRGVGAIELKQLASLYRVSISALLEDDAAEDGVVQLRVALRIGEATNHGAGEMVERLERIITDDFWLRKHVGENEGAAAWKPIKVSSTASREKGAGYDRGYRVADAFRMHYTLGESPIRDVSLLADEVGVLVSRLPLGVADAPDGCSAIDAVGGSAYILVNSDKPRVRRRFTIAHELGHLALGHLKPGDLVLDGHLSSTLWQETEANAFAAGLLMPSQGVRGAVKRLQARLGVDAGALERVVWLAESFGVSEEAAAYRLVNLRLGADLTGVHTERTDPAIVGIVGPESRGVGKAVRALKDQQGVLRRVRMQLGLAPVMADAERGVTEVGPAMRARVARALEDGLISVERAASILHVPVHEAYRWITESGIQLGHGPSGDW